MTTPIQPGPTPARARLRSSRSRAALGGAALALALGTGAAVAADPPETVADTNTGQQAAQIPPPVRLATPAVSLAVTPYTSCWSSDHVGQCTDGRPPRPAPSLGETSRRHMTLSFGRAGWHFVVSVVDRDGNRTRVHLVRTDPRRWRLDLGSLGNGHYRADVFGSGPQGDVAAVVGFTLS